MPEHNLGGTDLLCDDLQSDNIERVAPVYGGEVWLEAIKCTQTGVQYGAGAER